MRRLIIFAILIVLSAVCVSPSHAAATRYAVADGNWSDTANVWSDSDGGAAGNYVPADGDTFVILAGVDVRVDVDQSGWTGLAGTNIIRGGVTPGSIYWSNGKTGYLKFRTGATLEGTTDTNRGRMLANSDGSWAGTTALQNADKAVIDLQGTAKVVATNLDIRLYGTEPTNKFVRTYGTKYEFEADMAVNPATDVINLGTTPPSEGTAVLVIKIDAGATLPTGLLEDYVYYVRVISGNTCKLATQNADANIVDITADGTQTIALITGYTSGSSTVNVLENVLSDAPWTTTDGYDRVVLVDAYAPSDYDQQRVQLNTINASSMVLSTTVDSSQYPGAKIFLSSRNVSIRSAGTSSSQPIIEYSSGSTHGGVFGCEINNTDAGLYGYGISYGSGHTISGTISGCASGIYYGSGHTISGTISGCYYGTNYGSGHIISGTISGCSNGINYGSGHTISGTISGCNYGIYYGSGHTSSGTISGCSSGIYFGSGHTISGTINGCNYGIYAGSGHIISGTINGCAFSFRDSVGFITVKRGANVTYSFYATGVDGQKYRVSAEDYGGTANAMKVFDNAGNITKTACDGTTANYPDEDPDGGNGYAIEASSLQAIISATNPLYLISDRSPHRIWLTAGTWEITYKVYSTYNIADNGLTLAATYISAASPRTITRSTDSQAIAAKTSDTDWTQTLSITVVTAAEGWVDLDMYLTQYENGGAVFVWPTPTITSGA